MKKILESFVKLRDYCEAEDFKGYDPYDGLNSQLFNVVPGLKDSAFCRLAWIQLFKRLPFNLRPIAGIKKAWNAKGIGLFIEGYATLLDILALRPELSASLGKAEDIKRQIERLVDILISLKSNDTHGAAWGYNFPWQCRLEFLFPAGEPTVVATNFCSSALLHASKVCDRDDWRQIAVTSAEFIEKDLRRTTHNGGFMFSYSMRPGNDTIYNASLLGSRLLCLCAEAGAENGDRLKELAAQSVKACCGDQREDGFWTYGVIPATGWIDSFHTGYNLDALADYERITGDRSFHQNLEKGLSYYLRTFFDSETGQSSYYHDRTYPVDIHCPGQLPITLSRTGQYETHRELAKKVLHRAIDTMQSPRGYFYYQLKKGISSHISYMRWSNAFMFASLATALLEEIKTSPVLPVAGQGE